MNKSFSKIIIALGLLLALVSTAWAQAQPANTSSFVVKKIQFIGLQRIDSATALSYLKVQVGDTLSPGDYKQAVLTPLLNTGFFESNISLRRPQGSDTLQIMVHERPIIGNISITGNHLIQTDQLKKILDAQKISVGREYDPAVVQAIETGLKEEYKRQGKYNATVSIKPVVQGKDRVNLDITISEGLSATIREISIIGNQHFKTNLLLRQMTLTTPTFFSFFTKDDEYSKEKLDADLATLTSFYQDRGYINFKDSALVQITPDQEHVNITITVSEGPLYTVNDISFAWVNDVGAPIKGNPIISGIVLTQDIPLKKGQTFSRQNVLDSEKAIGEALGNKGYALPEIQAVPTPDEATHQVSFKFLIDPRHRMYVHKIDFTGNLGTNGDVLRSAMQQKEGALYSQKDVSDSTYKLNQLPFLKNIRLDKTEVPNTNNQLDLHYKVDEVPAASANFGVGYSQLDGLLLTVGLTQQNFLGKGTTVGINFTTSAWQRIYQFNYFDPYFTKDGIGFGTSAYFQQNNFANANAADYALDDYGFSNYFSIPLSLRNSISLGGGFDHTRVKLGGSSSTQLNNFTAKYGNIFQNANVTAGWSYSGLDRLVFPTLGVSSSLNTTLAIPTDSRSFKYYLVTYDVAAYHPLVGNFIFVAHGDANYGNGYGGSSRLPFYKNFFSGGMGSVRGYEDNSLGPQDSNNQPLGGNAAVDASLGIIFPNFISPDNLRTSVFVDAGNVFNTTPNIPMTGANPNGLRYSSGLEVDWLSPFGVLKFALSKALNASSGDNTSPFQFSIGTQF